MFHAIKYEIFEQATRHASVVIAIKSSSKIVYCSTEITFYLEMIRYICILIVLLYLPTIISAQERARARDIGVVSGILTPGSNNAITDVEGVSVGHRSLIQGDSVRTGVTVILPHQGNIFKEKVPAGIFVGNGFGKSVGTTQIEELGNIESPIALTNTLNTFTVANALIDYMLDIPENSDVRSLNPIVGETNDGWLNDIRGRHVKSSDVLEAIQNASNTKVDEGNVGAGTGTRCLGFKGGIGTSSRVLPKNKGGYTVGVLVQTNFGGILRINGAPVGRELNNFYMAEGVPYVVDGSCMIIIATDAPLSSRNLQRLARRSFLAFGRVGSFSSNGSGDYSIAFSTHKETRVPYSPNSIENNAPRVLNDFMSPLFLAVVEATEESIYNSLFMAEDMVGQQGRAVKALPIKETLDVLDNHKARNN
ncbi:P1 family peptidase [Pricia sp. S334]|uniref:P1 family peptidase n=1 Tax=Pricia mediterranea TaxID=3076079 RepID=A0ABU3L2M7_9FLAO|nr:P1 family peptidase [Pricia sp. S334]MDT7827439.1 P1 family peptidase [Pricia sp. S334]